MFLDDNTFLKFTWNSGYIQNNVLKKLNFSKVPALSQFTNLKTQSLHLVLNPNFLFWESTVGTKVSNILLKTHTRGDARWQLEGGRKLGVWRHA